MDCPHKIPPSRTPVTHHKAHKGCHTRLSSSHHWEDWERWNQPRSKFHYWRHHSSSHHNSHKGHSRSQQWDRCSHHRGSSQQSHLAHRGCSHRPHCNTLHWSQCRSSTHHNSFSYWSQDCSRSHSQLFYQPSRHESCRSDSYSSRTRRSYTKRTWRWR